MSSKQESKQESYRAKGAECVAIVSPCGFGKLIARGQFGINHRYRQLSWEEIRTMLDLDMEEPRAFREAREDEGRSLILYQLTQKFGELPESFQERINALSRERLRQLSGDLLNFTDLVDLETWLAQLFGE